MNFKRIMMSLVFLLFIIPPSLIQAQTQTNPYFTVLNRALFRGTAFSVYEDATKDIGIYKAYYVLSNSTADTITSNAFKTISGDEVLSLHTVNVSGSVSFNVLMGVFMGPGYGTDGYKWNDCLSISAAGDTTFSITQASWNVYYASPFHKVKIEESGVQQNKYYLNIIMWDAKNY